MLSFKCIIANENSVRRVSTHSADFSNFTWFHTLKFGKSHFHKQAALGRGITNVPIRTSSCPLIFHAQVSETGGKEQTRNYRSFWRTPEYSRVCGSLFSQHPHPQPLVATLLSHLCWCFSPNPKVSEWSLGFEGPVLKLSRCPSSQDSENWGNRG